MKIYHYTSIENLALILKNKTIRFNRMDRVNDTEECNLTVDGVKLSQYLFISCWTESKEESIPLWKIYTNNGIGVRIGLEQDMFKLSSTFDEYTDIFCLTLTTLFLNHPFYIIPPTKDISFYRNIQYVDDIECKKNEMFSSEHKDGNLEFTLKSKLGVYKHKRWDFEKESRFMLQIYPRELGFNSLSEDGIRSMLNAIKNNTPTLINYYDMPLNLDVMNSMEITLSPSCLESHKIIVESLAKEYLLNANIKDSKLKNSVNLR